MNQLIKASDLALPRISGTVSVNLEELDRLRSEHATAVKLAQELESKQGLVKIVVGEVKWQNGYSTLDSKGRDVYHAGSNQFVQQSVEYKGFEEFRETIRIEEYVKIEKDIKTLRESVDTWKKSSNDLSMGLAEANTNLSQKDKELNKLKSENEAMVKQATKSQLCINELTDELTIFRENTKTLQKAFDDLQNRKVTLGYWFKTKLENILK